MGTTVVAGRGVMRVTGTGSDTELGRIATSLQEHGQEPTPLQVRLRAFSRSLTRLVIAVTAVIFLTGVLRGSSLLDMLRVSIVLAIAAVPEGLLIAVTVILVLGMRRILKRNGLVKKLLAVETLGSVTVICTDKTGTLTEGRMRVTRTTFDDAQKALQAMVLCNDLEGPVDIALWEHARKQMAADPQTLADGAERLEVELFSSESKFMVTANRLDGQSFNYLKGAPEVVLDMCQVSSAQRGEILAQIEGWAGEGLRTLGLAYRPMGALELHTGYKWIGLVGMEDPVRPDVPGAIAVARRAGIQVKMITGDYRRTAEKVARSIGLHATDDTILDGQDLAALDDAQLQSRVGHIAIFSRIRPSDKLRIVRALQARGEVTAMIGDGVNDAPALRRANIGVVVSTATDVAKETADLILLDNSFTTVVAAIEEGRLIFENIRKVVAYTLSNSFAEVLMIFASMLLGWPAPLLVAQVLWIHLICDGPADISLAFEPMEKGIMEEKPKSLREPILDHLGLSLIGIISTASAVIALLLFSHYWQAHGDIAEARTYAFGTFALNSMIYIFGYRSLRRSILRSGRLSQNKALVVSVLAGVALAVVAVVFAPIRQVLGLVDLNARQWGTIFGVGLSLLVVVEFAKQISNRMHPAERVQVPMEQPSGEASG